MSVRAFAVPALLAFALAGCLSHAHEARPDDWLSSPSLTAVSGGKMHNADEWFTLQNASLPQPASCVAYQDGVRDDRDSCSVAGAIGSVPWQLKATFDGAGERLYEDVEMHPERRTVVAFDSQQKVAAHWDGLARHGSFVTE